MAAIDGDELVMGARFAIEELHDAHAADVFLGKGVDLGDVGADAAVALADALAEDAGEEQDSRDYGESEQGQRPAHPQHDDDDEEKNEDVFEDSKDAGGEHLVECVDVGRDAGDEFADGLRSKKAGDIRWMWRKIWLRRSNMIFWPVHCIR